MNIEIWNTISLHFSENNSKCFSNNPIFFTTHCKNIVLLNNIFFPLKKQNKKSKNLNNTIYFLEKIKNTTSFPSHVGTHFRKINFLFSLLTFSIFYSSLKQLTFVTTSLVFKVIFIKHHKKNTAFKSFKESEILLNFKFDPKLCNINIINKLRYIAINTQKLNLFLEFYENLFTFFFKKINNLEILFEKKKLSYKTSTVLQEILSEITCKGNYFSSSINFFANLLRLSKKIVTVAQMIDYSKSIFLRPFSTEGTNFLKISLLLKFQKIFNIKEIFNKIPTKKTEILFRQFSKFLIQKNNHQEFVLHALSKISSEKIIMGNILIIFKCILKIQERITVIYTSLFIYNLTLLFRENFDLILKTDDFFHFETYLLPIRCIQVDKESHLSILKKEKDGKGSFSFFFSNSIRNVGYPLYLKFFLFKILSRILKKPKYTLKNHLVEILFKIIKKISTGFFHNTIKKTIQFLKKHCSMILRTCNISRLLYIYQNQKLNLKSNEKKGHIIQIKKRSDKRKISGQNISSNASVFSLLDFN